MNVLTVTRDYGAGGYEVARALAERLGWELLDRELLHQAAAVEHLPDAELERLDEKAVRLADRFRLHPPHQRYLHGLTEAARQAAARGKVVLVGRGTGQLLADFPHTLHLRLVAPREWRARRMARLEGWSLDEALARCAEQDRTRERFTRYFFGDTPFEPWASDLIFHTGRVPLADVVAGVEALVLGSTAALPPTTGPRVLTLSRELAAGDDGIITALAGRLGLEIHDRRLLEQEALRLGVTEADLAAVDEKPSGLFHRWRPGSLSQRYLDALGHLMHDLAVRGDVLLVGRGGNRILRDHAGAFHVRLNATPLARVRRIMESRWMREDLARRVLADSDSRRRRFHDSAFGADWADSLEYDLTVNAARLGSHTAGVLARAASLRWSGRAGIVEQQEGFQ
jgi:cytidylate kinase